MKSLVVLTLYDEKGASSRYRAYIFQKKMQEFFNVSWYTFWDKKYTEKYMNNKKGYRFEIIILSLIAYIKRIYQLIFIVPKADVVFIQKECIPWAKHLFLSRAKKKGTKIVFDIDDANYLRKKDNSDRIAQIADAVICGNSTLYEHYSLFNPNCFILPTVEETPKYRPLWADTFSRKVIGWIGSNASIKNLEVIVEPLNKLIKKHSNVEFYIISDSDMGFTNKIHNSKLIKWDLNTYLDNLSKFTIGIMPLLDTQYNAGKCGFKLVQYLNMKKPVVATDLGVNKEIVGKCGFMASSTEEWIEAMETLLFEKKQYDECVRQINESFFEKYDFDVVAKRLIEVLDQ